MAKFGTNNRLAGTQQVLATTYKTQVILSAATATLGRGQLYEINVGADDVPNATDCAISYDISRSTTIGTGTAVVPVSLAPDARASGTVGTANLTIEPTITATSSMLALVLNQRASQRWIAAPSSELVWPNINLNGVSIRALSTTYASKVLVTALHEDL